MTRALVLGAFAVWIACTAIRFATPTPLGHDEARYAISAHDLVEGQPARWSYVPVGMTAIGVPGVLAGGSERALRVVPALLALAFLVAAWRLGVAVGGREAGAWTVAVIAGTPPLLRLQIDLLSDLGSAACLLAAIAVLVRELRRDDGPRWSILWAGALCAAALYIRYGSCLVIAIIAVAVVVFGRRDRRVLATGALFGVLVLPHAIQAIAETGSPLGILLDSATVPPHGGGLVGYLRHPIAYFGIVPAALVVVAAVAAVVRRERWVVAAAAIGVADIIALGIMTAPQSRYVTTGLVLLVAAGVASLRDVLARFPIPAVCVVAATWIVGIAHAPSSDAIRRQGMRTTLVAAPAIAADAHGRPCEVLARHALQLEWYTGCRAIQAVPGQTSLVYAVRDNTGGPWQPDEMPGTRILDRPGFVQVTRLPAP